MPTNEKLPEDVLILKLTRKPWRVDVGGSITEIDLALAMLEQAKRFFETQAHIVAMTQQMKAAQDAEFAQSIVTGRRPNG